MFTSGLMRYLPWILHPDIAPDQQNLSSSGNIIIVEHIYGPLCNMSPTKQSTHYPALSPSPLHTFSIPPPLSPIIPSYLPTSHLHILHSLISISLAFHASHLSFLSPFHFPSLSSQNALTFHAGILLLLLSKFLM